MRYSCKPVVSVLVTVLFLAACTDTGTLPLDQRLDSDRPAVTRSDLPDLSGGWEKNYGRSDDFNNKFNLFLFDVQRGITTPNQVYIQGPVRMSGPLASRESLVGLARFTEEITRLPLIDITQNDSRVEIDRPDDFPLICTHAGQGLVSNRSDFGTERCGWNREQLVFQMAIGDSLVISHQFTLSPDKQELNIITTVSSAQVSAPLTISNYYRRVEGKAADYGCILTLTRNTVCSQYGL